MSKGSFFFVDCEGRGGCPSVGQLAEFGVVHYPSRESFHGVLFASTPDPVNPAIPRLGERVAEDADVARALDAFVKKHVGGGRAIMVSDNPAYDFMWVADLCWRTLGYNPFGYSARRISDFYAGLVGNWFETQRWKSLRITDHDHNPVHDALGNVEAFERLLAGERP